MRKKIKLTAMILTAALCVSSMPFSVFAEIDTENIVSAESDGSEPGNVAESESESEVTYDSSEDMRELDPDSNEANTSLDESEQINQDSSLDLNRPSENAAFENEEYASDDISTMGDDQVEDNIAIEDTEGTEESPVIDQSETVSSDAAFASEGSVDGDSHITWTTNSMPAIFDITSLHLIKRGYLTAVDDGYMRVGYDGKAIIIEYYDNSFKMTRQGHLSMELSVWGGFYKGEDAYYIVEGQNNADCIDGTEVLRIIKYDFNWTRIGAGNILAEEGWEYEIRYPFDYSCVNMDEINGKLYVVTGREGYVDDLVGQGHQGMMLIRMDEETFSTEIVYGDFWHSFAQYMGHSGTDLYLGELSEGSRCTSLSRFDTNRTGTDYFDAFSERFSVLDYGGNRESSRAIECYASVDDMAVSSDNILCLGTSIDQSQYDNVTDDTAHNVYLTVTPKANLDSEHTSVKWLTNYAGAGKCFIGANITKIDDDKFLLIWEEHPGEAADDSVSLSDSQDTLSSGDLHYVFVNGAGDVISNEFTAPAMISDCHPVLDGNQIVYYASNANCLAFYTIDIDSGAFSKSVTRVAGDNITWSYKNGTLSFSGSGSISIDLEGACRYATSSASSMSSYFDSDNCWKYIRDGVTTISIGKGITAIPERMFAWYNNLTDVKLPQGLKSIGNEAFYACGNLRKLSIPDSVNKIGNDILWTGYYWTSDESHVVYATIYGNCTSYGIKYAKKNGISYQITHKRETSPTTIKATTTKNGRIGKKCSLCGNVSKEKTIYYPKTISLSKTSFVYNAKVQKPKITVKGSDGKTIAAANYKLTFSKGCKTPGKYSAKITFKGNYSGTVTKTYTIVPKGTTLSTATAASKAFTVKWKKQATQTTGYQIQYSTTSNFKSGKKTITVKGPKVVSKKISGLKVRKKYYVRIRTYKTVGGKNYCSAWSKAMAVTTK